MKTIRAIKGTKNVQVGTIKRIGEKEADSEVKGGYWEYIPKSEWKSKTKNQESSSTEEESQKSNKKNKKNEKNSK